MYPFVMQISQQYETLTLADGRPSNIMALERELEDIFYLR